MKRILLTMLLFSGLANAQIIEISVVTDWETVSYYGSVEETQSAIDAAFEYADNIFVGQLNINTQITFIDIPTTEADDTIANHTHAIFLLESLFEYVNENEEHRNADITLLLTKRNLAIGSQDVVGYAKYKTVCSASSIAMVELVDNGLDGQTLAHELAHVLGAVHDGDAPCESTPNRGYLMSSAVHSGSDNFSQCSLDTINSTVDTYGYCLLEDNTTPVITTQPPFVETTRGGGGKVSIAFLFFLTLAVLLFLDSK